MFLFGIISYLCKASFSIFAWRLSDVSLGVISGEKKKKYKQAFIELRICWSAYIVIRLNGSPTVDGEN